MKIPLVLALFLLASIHSQQGAQPAELARVREELSEVGARWDAARTGFDTAAFERMLAPDFWVQIGAEKLTRARFLEMISKPQPGARLVRFDSRILTLARDGEAWAAVVLEKLEAEVTGPDGAQGKSYGLWVTRDRFREEGDGWTCLSSEALGSQSWSGGQTPPFEDWSS
jgi:hypothetical protein